MQGRTFERADEIALDRLIDALAHALSDWCQKCRFVYLPQRLISKYRHQKCIDDRLLVTSTDPPSAGGPT